MARTDAVGSADTVVKGSGSLNWGQLALVSAGPLTAFAAMVNFAPVLPLVRDELGLSNTWAGILASTTFFSHTLLQLPGGQFTDSIGGKRAFSLSLFLVGFSLIASGLVASLPLLLLFRFILGLGTGLTFIAGITFTHLLAPPDKRVMAQSIFGASGNLGVFLVLLTMERGTSMIGWRGAFLVEGLLALVIALLVTARLSPGPETRGAVYPSWGETFGNPTLYLLGLAHVLTFGIYVGLTNWSATFLWQRYGVGLEFAGPLAAFLAISAVVGRITGGAISAGRERNVILISCAATGLFTAAFPLMPSMGPALAALLALGWFASMPFGAVFSYVSRVSSQGVSGRGLSVINFIGNVGAFAFPPLIGYALDLSGSFALGFGAMAAIGLAGSAVVALMLPRARGS